MSNTDYVTVDTGVGEIICPAMRRGADWSVNATEEEMEQFYVWREVMNFLERYKIV